MVEQRSIDAIAINGFVCEVGDFNAVQEKHKPGRSRGFVIECPEVEVTVMGLSKEHCRLLAKHMRDPVYVTISFSDPEAK